ncbi:SRPBCC domain-containing protein [Alsobacter sp. KACC 23698]|uniref:SRPBCC domain-containing protein n=1 Tax=Alsobacter sp. KACC 23698 TaxID=3149229 RepID=A0AAU7JK00_9HYPH
MMAMDQASASFTLDEATHTLRFARDLRAAPVRVFEAWTQPEQLARWWDPTGERLAVCEIDLRPGGAFRFVSAHHPDRPFTGRYHTIAPPALLVFSANGATGKVMLAERPGGTRMTVEIVCSSADHLAQFVAMGVAAGTSKTLDNLERLFSTP